jgi:hypothetical protein
MKTILMILSLVSLLAFSNSCNKNSDQSGIQREEAMEGSDFRETKSYDEGVPAQEEEDMQEDRESINMGPNESSVRD